MPKAGYLVTHRLTQAEADAQGAALAGGMIEIVDADRQPTGDVLAAGPAGQAPASLATSTDVQQAVAAALKKVALTGTGSVALTYAAHNGAEVHAESGITECTMALTAFQANTEQQTGSFYLFNYSGANLPLKLGVGWAGGISEDGEATNDLTGAGTLVSIPHARKALVIFDADGWVRATLMGVEVTQAELDVVAAATATKADNASMQRVHEKALAVSKVLAHPVNFTGATATGTDGSYTVAASSAYPGGTYEGWKAFDGLDNTDWASQSQTANLWVSILFPVAKIVSRVVVRGRNAGTERITSWRVEGSNDGANWTTLHTSATALGNTAQTFDFSNKMAYLRYRLFGVTGEVTNPGLSRLEFHEESYTPASHTHAQADVTSLSTDLAAKAPLASPALTGTPTAPTAAAGTNTTQLATAAFVRSAVEAAVAGLLDYRGAFTPAASSGSTGFPTAGGSGTSGAVMKGDAFVASAEGFVATEAIQTGDVIIANVDTPGQTLANWDKLQRNVTYVPENQANRVTALSGPTDAQYPSAKLLSDQLALKQGTLTAGQLDALNKVVATATRAIPNFAALTATGTLGTYTITRISAYNSSYEAWLACQASQPTDGWATLGQSSNIWLAIQFPQAKVITRIRVAGRSSGERPNAGWKLQGSNNGTDWTDLYTAASAMALYAAPENIDIAHTTAYIHYRMFSATASGTNPGMSVFWLYENQYSFPTVAV